MTIRSKRNQYIAGHVRKSVKKALEQAARKAHVSQSEYISLAVEEKLRQDGFEVTQESTTMPGEVPLPLEG